MPKKNRDDFSVPVCNKLAKRARYICSNPTCRRPTMRPDVSDDGVEYYGEASHITAAAPGGPRYDPSLTPAQRMDAANGIHLCKICARKIDVNNGAGYPATLLREWKTEHDDWLRQDGSESQISSAYIASTISSLVQDALKNSVPADASIEGTLSPLLDNIRAALEAKRPKEAFRRLEELRNQHWTVASKALRGRIATYQGNACYAVGQLDRAATFYLEGYGEAPDEEFTNSHAALAYLISEDAIKAEAMARQTLERFPVSTLAASVLLHTVNPTDVSAFSQQEIPAPIRNSVDVLMNCATVSRLHGDLTSSERWAREAAKQDTSSATPWATLGEVLFARALDVLQVKAATVRQVQRSEEAKCLLADAEAAYTTAWDKLVGSEVCENNVEWLVNRARIRILLDKTEEAKKDFSEALRIAPDTMEASHAQAIIAIEEGRVDEGVQILRQLALPASAERVVDVLTLAEVLIQRGKDTDLSEARGLLNDLAEYIEEDDLKESAAVLTVMLEVQSGNHTEARGLASELLNDSPASLKVFIAAAHAFSEICEGEMPKNRQDLLNRAVAQLNDKTLPSERLEIGQLLFKAERYHDTVTALEPICIPGEGDYISYATIYSLYQIKAWRKARDMAQAVVEKQGPCAFYSEILTAILDGIGDIPSAMLVAGRYLDVFPNDLGMCLRLAYFYLRTGDEAALSRLLEKPIDISSARPAEVIRLVALLDRLGKREEALRKLYEARQRFPLDASIHDCYIKFFLFAGRRQMPHILDSPEKVESNTYVTTVDEKGNEQGYWIEERPFCTGTNFLTPSHALAKQLMGKRRDEIVTRSGTNPIGQAYRPQFKIKSIESVYLRAFVESRDNFEHWFPDFDGLFTLNVAKEGANTSDPDEMDPDDFDLTPVFQMIDAHDERRQIIENFYDDYLLPLSTVAQRAGCDIWVAWRAYAWNSRRRIRCNRGDAASFNKAVNLAHTTERFTADPTSLLTLFYLPHRDVLTAKTGPLLVTQCVIDEFRRIADAHLEENQHDSVMVKREGLRAYSYHETLPEHKAADQAETQQLLDWVLAHTEIRPLNLLLDADGAKFDQFRESLGLAYSDPILLARELNTVLYTDDLALAEFGREVHGIDSISTAALLRSMNQNQILPNKEYEEAQLRLLAWNYDFVPITAPTIVRAAEMSDWMPRTYFTATIETLRGDRSGASSVEIGAEAVRLLANKVDGALKRAALIDAVLTAVTRKRDAHRTIQEIKQRIIRSTTVWTPQYDDLLRLVNSWQTNRVL